jgi:HK97 family phage portal protein
MIKFFQALLKPFQRRSSLSNPDGWFINMAGGQPTFTGRPVTAATAMQSIAVYACVKILAESVASSPLFVYKRIGAGKEKARNFYLYPVLHGSPNDQQTSYEFKSLVIAHWALRGNHYSEKLMDQGGRVRGLSPLDPDRMSIKWGPGGDLIYEYRFRNGGQKEFTPDQIFHFRGLSTDGICGLSPIAQFRQAIGVAQAQEEYAGRMYGNGMRPSGVFEHPEVMSQEAHERLQESIKERYVGLENAGNPVILEEGMKWHSISMTAEDAQFLESRNFQVAEIARIFRIPLHMLNELTHATFSNVEHLGIDFVVHTLRPILVSLEESLAFQLLTPAEREDYSIEFLVDALLRGDTESRFKAYSIARVNGWMSANEIRERENMNPLPPEVGDVYLTPVNMAPADQQTDQGDGKKPAPPEPKPKRFLEFDHSGYIVEGSPLHSALDILLRDAFHRMITKEIKAIDAKIRKVAQDGSVDDMQAWLLDFYAEQRSYYLKTVGPTVTAISDLVGDECEPIDLDSWADAYITKHRRAIESALRRGDGSEILRDWAGTAIQWKTGGDAREAVQTARLMVRERSKDNERKN